LVLFTFTFVDSLHFDICSTCYLVPRKHSHITHTFVVHSTFVHIHWVSCWWFTHSHSNCPRYSTVVWPDTYIVGQYSFYLHSDTLVGIFPYDSTHFWFYLHTFCIHVDYTFLPRTMLMWTYTFVPFLWLHTHTPLPMTVYSLPVTHNLPYTVWLLFCGRPFSLPLTFHSWAWTDYSVVTLTDSTYCWTYSGPTLDPSPPHSNLTDQCASYPQFWFWLIQIRYSVVPGTHIYWTMFTQLLGHLPLRCTFHILRPLRSLHLSLIHLFYSYPTLVALPPFGILHATLNIWPSFIKQFGVVGLQVTVTFSFTLYGCTFYILG